jgi:hypothetical protein
MKFFPSVIPPVYTDRHIRSVFTDGMTDEICRIKKKDDSLTWMFLQVILPTESPRNSKRQIRMVTWPLHRLTCRRNHRGIQSEISVQWRALFTVRMADGITYGIILSVNPSAKVNICPLCRLCSSSSQSQLSPTANNQPPPQKKKKNLPLLSTTSHISWSFVVTTFVFWFTDKFYQFL